jgi:hypothetical protein
MLEQEKGLFWKEHEMTQIPVRQLSADLARARRLIASATASPELDTLVVADVLGVAIELDSTYPPPPPLGEAMPSADPAADLRTAAELLTTEVNRSAGVADAVHVASVLHDLHAVIAALSRP